MTIEVYKKLPSLAATGLNGPHATDGAQRGAGQRRVAPPIDLDRAQDSYNEAMLKPIARTARSRPVLFAALLGALFGLISTIVGEVAGVLSKSPNSLMLLMLPAATAGYRVTAPRVMQTAIVLLVETTANILVDTLLFAAVAGLIVLARRILRRRKV